MGRINKIDSNSTASSYCEEATLGVLPDVAEQVWVPLEPNSYSDFGGKVTTVARNPINSGRQRKKGVVTDIEASGGLNSDVTQTNLQSLMQGFVFADLRRKAEQAGGAAVAADKTYAIAVNPSGFAVGHLVFVSGYANSGNNGLKHVTAVDATHITVSETVIDETAPASAKIVAVGFQFTTADATIDGDGGSLPALKTTTKDLTSLGLIPGEVVFIGGDTGPTQFGTTNNGFARVRSVAAHAITFDKTADTMVDDLGVGKTVQIFFGRVLKNEVGTLIKRRSYTLERQLGANDDSDTTKQQAEYLEGSIPSEFSLNVPTAAKTTVDMSFMALRNYTLDENDAGVTLRTKTPGVTNLPLIEADAFNTSSDVSRFKLASVIPGQPNPQPLFAFVQEFSLKINNNLSGNKAIGVTGSFEVTSGQFDVSGSITAYFSDVAAVNAVRNNADITLEAHFVKANAGISFDVPLITLGDGRPNVAQDQAITLPLETMAATGAKIDPNLNHTLLVVFWDFLPNAADL